MDTRDVIAELSAIERRAAGSDAERRASRAVAQRLRRSGRRGTRVETVWVRPHWPVVHALICGVAIAGSVLSVDHEVVGLALAGGALVALVADLAGIHVLRLLTFERATQNVVSPDPRGEAKPVRLVLTAAVDAPRGGLHRRVPGLHRVLVAALLVLTACCALRLALEDVPDALGAVQLLPTVVLIGVAGLFLDAAAAPVAATADASAVAAVLAVVAALDRRPPRALAVEAVLAGAGHAHALGMRRWVREQRRAGVRAEEVCVIDLAACGAGTPVWWTHDGLVLPLRYSAQLRGLAEGVARSESRLRARPVRGSGMSGARAARARGWPALAIGALGAGNDDSEPDPEAVAATVEFALALIAALDRDLLERDVAFPPPGGG
ncbi:MAG TPA: hypothetical protein VFZ89_03290 [Solirubrobacteraceae bacterium]